MPLPRKSVAYDFYISLIDAFNTELFLENPTIAAGDFTISKDGGAFIDLAILPAVTPTGGVAVKVSLSAAEMEAEKLVIQASDQNGSQWLDLVAFVDVPTGTEETAVDLLEGDHDEAFNHITIFKKGTSEAVLDKDVGGSLLTPGVTITTREP